MGSSVSVKVFYGYAWDENEDDSDVDLGDFSKPARDDDQDDEDEDSPSIAEWSKVIAVRRGHVNPWSAFVASTAREYKQRKREDDQWIATHRAEIDAWHAVNKAIKAEFDVELGSHGHSEYSVWHVSALVFATGSCTEALDLSALPEVDPAWRERLDRWLAEFNIPAPQDAPRWWAVSSYG